MKIIQFGDLHLDAPMERLRPEKAAARRMAARELLREIVGYAENAGAKLLLCTGDLFDSQTPYRDTVEFVTGVFAGTALPVFISPGNHDFYARSSPYAAAEWSENVHIFRSETPETVFCEAAGCTVTGFAYLSDRPALRPLHGWRAAADGVPAAFAGHGETGVSASEYAAFPQEDIAASGLCYLALGHIHKPGAVMAGQTLVVENGSVEGRGYDECGERGFYEVTLGGGSAPESRLIPSSGSRAVRLTVTDVPGDAGALCEAVFARCPFPPERTMLRLEAPAGEAAALTERLAGLFLDVKLAARRSESASEPGPQTPLVQMFAKRAAAARAAAKTEREALAADYALRFGLAALENREQPRHS